MTAAILVGLLAVITPANATPEEVAGICQKPMPVYMDAASPCTGWVVPPSEAPALYGAIDPRPNDRFWVCFSFLGGLGLGLLVSSALGGKR